jgi:predicted house-cleaning noncanonical NTP pyrophosphatase (MazG superfamily)
MVDAPRAPLPGTTPHARRLALGRVRKVEDQADLTDFEADPRPFDLGGHRVVFRPTTELIRIKPFLAAVGAAARKRGWRVVLEGSKLAHNWYLLRSSGVDVESSADYLAQPKRRRIFDKLVRDKVPSAIEAKGELVSAMELPNPALRAALRRKLVEEALEVANAEGDQAIVDELADVFEVMQALQRNLGLHGDEIERRAEKKRTKRGGFDRGLFLRSTGGDRSDDATGRRDYVRLERKGNALQLVVPLVPPLSPKLPDIIRLKMAQISITITATYEADRAILRFSSARPIEEDRQLSLFGPDDDKRSKE